MSIDKNTFLHIHGIKKEEGKGLKYILLKKFNFDEVKLDDVSDSIEDPTPKETPYRLYAEHEGYGEDFAHDRAREVVYAIWLHLGYYAKITFDYVYFATGYDESDIYDMEWYKVFKEYDPEVMEKKYRVELGDNFLITDISTSSQSFRQILLCNTTVWHKEGASFPVSFRLVLAGDSVNNITQRALDTVNLSQVPEDLKPEIYKLVKKEAKSIKVNIV